MQIQQHVVVALIAAICVFAAHADAANFTYIGAPYGLTKKFVMSWNNASIWRPNGIPTSADNLVIYGCSQCTSGFPKVQLDLGSNNQFNNIYYYGLDEYLSWSGNLTVNNLYLTGGWIQGSRLNILNSAVFNTRDSYNTISNTTIYNAPGSTVNFVGSINFGGSTLINAAGAVWFFNAQGGQAAINPYSAAGSAYFQNNNVFINNGLLIFETHDGFSTTPRSTTWHEGTETGQDSGSTVNLKRNFYMYCGFVNTGTLIVGTGSELTIKTVNGASAYPVFNNTGILTLEEFSVIFLSDYVVMNLISGTLNGTGELYFISEGTAPTTINYYYPLTYNGIIKIDGTGVLRGTSDLTVDTLIQLGGSTIIGPANATVRARVYTISSSPYLLSYPIVYVSRINVVVSEKFYLSTGLNLVSGSDITFLRTCVGKLVFGAFNGNTTTSVVTNYGLLQSATSATTFFNYNVPLRQYGTIDVPTFNPDRSTSQYIVSGAYLQDCVINGPEMEFSDTIYEDLALSFVGGVTVGRNVTFGPGPFHIESPCTSDQNPSCLAPSTFELTAPITIPYLWQGQASILKTSTPSATISQYIIIGGITNGTYPLTVTNGIRTDAGYGNVWTVESIDVIVTQNFVWNTNSIAFTDGGRFIIAPGATSSATSLSGYTYGFDGAIVNNGTWTWKIGQRSYALIGQNFINLATMNSEVTITDRNGPSGIKFQFNAGFYQGPNGVINMNVYSATDFDIYFQYPTLSDICLFSGTLNLNFHYTPVANTAYQQFLSYLPLQSGIQRCNGTFRLTSNLNSNLVPYILYDIPVSGTEVTYGSLVLCASSNASCSSLFQRRIPTPTSSNTQMSSTFSTTSTSNEGPTSAISSSSSTLLTLGGSTSSGSSTSTSSRSGVTVSSTFHVTSDALRLVSASICVAFVPLALMM